MPTNQISARTRGLGIELRELRANARLNTREAAKRVGIMSPATLNRIELGTKAPSPEEVSALLVVYNVGGVERSRLLDLAKETTVSGWWCSTHHGHSKHVNALINFESTAKRITNFQQSFIPGLLQVPDYTRAMMTCFDVPEDECERRVAQRVSRQVFLSRPEGPSYLAIIDEAALRRIVGGFDVMVQQVRHVAVLARRQNITIQVIPFSRGGHQGMLGSFAHLEFTNAPPIVFIEHRQPSVFLDQHKDTTLFQHMIDALREAALTPGDSMDFLTAVATELERR